jgi:squalene cyclase
MSASLPPNRFYKSIHNQIMSQEELSMISPSPVSLATLLDRELREEKGEKSFVKYGEDSMIKKGEDYGLIKTCCHQRSREGFFKKGICWYYFDA